MTTRGLRLPDLLVLLGLLAGGVRAAVAQQAISTADAACGLCHGELELLRQHVTRLEDARRLHVTSADVAASAHEGESCGSCHVGFRRWPHPEASRTATCASCHEVADDAWGTGVHAHEDEAGAEAADCTSCHGVHDVASAETLVEGEAMDAMSDRCSACHETSALPASDPHAGAVGCWTCHGSHALRDVDDPDALVSPTAQPATCGVCHEEPARTYPTDVHGSALAEQRPGGLSTLAILGSDAPPVCTSCHGGHDVLAVEAPEAVTLSVDRCGGCHTDHADRFFGTYHGKATALGSEIVATCDDCHSAHEVFAASEPGSWVHPERVVETCSQCHEHARPAFASYDSHPDPLDRSRNPPLFFSFVFMNTLLFSVLVVFGLHTLLWWVRILIERRREAAEGGSHV